MTYEQTLKQVCEKRNCKMYGDVHNNWPPCIAAPNSGKCGCVEEARKIMLEQSLQK